MNLIYKCSTKPTMEANFAECGIFVAQKNCISSTFTIAFGPDLGSAYPIEEEEITIALSNLKREGLLKENFNSSSELKRLKRSFRRVVLCHMLNQSYFGFSDTLNIIFGLISSNTPDYSSFFTEPHMSILPALSNNLSNILVIGYSHIVREHLTRETRNEIINEVRNIFDTFEHSSTTLEALELSFERFSNDLLNMNNYNSVYE